MSSKAAGRPSSVIKLELSRAQELLHPLTPICSHPGRSVMAFGESFDFEIAAATAAARGSGFKIDGI